MDANQSLIYEIACRIRAFEDAVAAAADQGKVPGFAHLCTGAEVLEATLCAAASGEHDFITGSHRSHGLAIGAGADPYATAAEIFGKAHGLSGGLGGTQHLLAPEKGFLTSNGIVGAQVPLAAGAALTAKTLGTGGIGVCVFGDGAANQGAVFETMNLASALKLPLLFVLENNGLGQSTSAEYASGGISFSTRAKAFGLRVETLAEDDILGTLKLIPELTDEIRSDGYPIFLEAFVPRLSGHYHGEKQDFKGDNEINDPLQVLEGHIFSSEQQATAVRQKLTDEIRVDVTRALQDNAPGCKTLSNWATNWRAGA